MAVLVQPELCMDSRHFEPAAVDPLVGALERALDQLGGMCEIVR